VSQDFLIHFAASGLAVAVLAGLAAWARIGRPLAPLDERQARALLAEEFPGHSLERVWVGADGAGALAKSGAAALVLVRVGDGYAARLIPWAKARAARARDGRISLQLADAAAPRATIAVTAWPPKDLAA
jgi:hypothetical protein